MKSKSLEIATQRFAPVKPSASGQELGEVGRNQDATGYEQIGQFKEEQ
jgi:hypothetical protein